MKIFFIIFLSFAKICLAQRAFIVPKDFSLESKEDCVPIFRLLVTPEIFDKKKVAVVGFVERNSIVGAIYASRDEMEHNIKTNSIKLKFPYLQVGPKMYRGWAWIIGNFKLKKKNIGMLVDVDIPFGVGEIEVEDAIAINDDKYNEMITLTREIDILSEKLSRMHEMALGGGISVESDFILDLGIKLSSANHILSANIADIEKPQSLCKTESELKKQFEKLIKIEEKERQLNEKELKLNQREKLLNDTLKLKGIINDK